jgi:uncharacterized membrane protein
MSDAVAFRRVAFSPLGCFQQSWRRIGDQYWMFAGIATAGMLIGSAAPLALLMGPMMCGIYTCYRRKWAGERVRFEWLFEGFGEKLLIPSVVATLAIVGLTFLFLIPLAVLGFIAFLAGAVTSAVRDEPGFAAIGPIILGGAFLLWFALAMILGTLFAFTYPLIADRKLPALDALRLSVRAVLAHLWRVLLLNAMGMAIGVAGLCCCYVGVFLVAPVTMGALFSAYEQIFGLAE